MTSDAPTGIAAAAICGATDGIQSEAGQRRPGGQVSSTPMRQSDRPADLVEGRVAGPNGALAGSAPDPDADVTGQAAEDDDDEWRRAGGQAGGA